MVHVEQKGSFNNIEKFLKASQKLNMNDILSKYGEIGVAALSAATPELTGKTASSWYYEISTDEYGNPSLEWRNSNVNKGVNIALIIQYGHGTKEGVYVQGIDYINPAMAPILDSLAKSIWKEVKEL